jgi:hypothetical protein
MTIKRRYIPALLLAVAAAASIAAAPTALAEEPTCVSPRPSCETPGNFSPLPAIFPPEYPYLGHSYYGPFFAYGRHPPRH